MYFFVGAKALLFWWKLQLNPVPYAAILVNCIGWVMCRLGSFLLSAANTDMCAERERERECVCVCCRFCPPGRLLYLLRKCTRHHSGLFLHFDRRERKKERKRTRARIMEELEESLALVMHLQEHFMALVRISGARLRPLLSFCCPY